MVLTHSRTGLYESGFFVDSLGGFKSEAQQGVDEWKLRIPKRLQACVRRPRMANEMHG
jgi:hypothetical protein